MIVEEIMVKLRKANAELYRHLFKHDLSSVLLSYATEISAFRVACVPRLDLPRHLLIDELGIHFSLRFNGSWHLLCLTFWKSLTECLCTALCLQIGIIVFGAPVRKLGQISS